MRKIGIFCIISIFLMIGLVGAVDFDVHNSSFIYEEYLDGDVVAGLLNISFDGQDNLDFTSSLGYKKVKLLDVLHGMNLTSPRDYSCEPLNCESRYQAYSGREDKPISIGEEKELYGFKIKENEPVEITGRNDLTFTVEVNDPVVDCENQLFIDMFNDGTIDFYNNQLRGDDPEEVGDCGSFFYPGGVNRHRGCFDPDDSSLDLAPLGDRLYCEYMEDIPPSAGYEIGGEIEVLKAGGNLEFLLYPADGGCDPLANWGLDNVSQNGWISHFIPYTSLEEFDALVCVYTTSGSDYFAIQTNERDDSCGLSFEHCDRVSKEDFSVDFNLHIIPKGYEPIGQVVFDNALYEDFTGRDLGDDLDEYLNITYGRNCSGEDGCVVPFSIWGSRAWEGQSIHSARLDYRRAGLLDYEETIYELREQPAKVTSGYVEIDVGDLGFKVPSENGKHTFKLSLGDDEVIRDVIDVDIGFSFRLTPRFAFIGRETLFNARTEAEVISSTWDFGDGSSSMTVQGPSAKHTYDKAGEYNLKVVLVKKVGSGTKNSTRRFKVLVGDARESAELALKDLEARITALEADTVKYPAWMQDSVKDAIGINAVKTVVQGARADFDLLEEDSPDSKYIEIVDSLLTIDLPYSVYTSSTGALPAFISYESVDVSHIEEIAISQVDNVELFKANMIAWMDEHYDVTVSFDTITANGEVQDVDLLKKYKVSITEKKSPGGDKAYLIIGYPKSTFVFSGTGGSTFTETSVSGGTFVELTANPINNVEFMILGSDAPTVADLGIYVSPAPRVLGISSDAPIKECWHMNCDDEGNFLWKRFIIGMSILLVLFFVVYILLQTWYRRNYEKHLFPNPNDLYNLLNFIYNSRRNGLRDSGIKKSLGQRKWNGEQINYAFRKLEGKRTGMWEIPLFKFAENRKVRKELQKKQGGRPLDTRFIKQPNL
ncbi:MAG: PKD domain-containing protein [archaeon]